jgi:hypothetical protein
MVRGEPIGSKVGISERQPSKSGNEEKDEMHYHNRGSDSALDLLRMRIAT